MLQLLEHPRVHTVIGDQCCYGLVSPTPDGKSLPAKKSTRFASSSRHMLHRLQRRCDNSHSHQQLVGGRAAQAAFYPTPLVEAMLRRIRDATDAEQHETNGGESAPLVQSVVRAGKPDDTPPGVAAKVEAADLAQKVKNAKLDVQYRDGRRARIPVHWK